MSRNLGCVSCYYCPSEVITVEKARPITSKEAGGYYTEYNGMMVANAECPACLAQYLAWCAPPPGGRSTNAGHTETHYDLSFRSSFNDEPGERDLPRYNIAKQLVRVSYWNPGTDSYIRLGVVPSVHNERSEKE